MYPAHENTATGKQAQQELGSRKWIYELSDGVVGTSSAITQRQGSRGLLEANFHQRPESRVIYQFTTLAKGDQPEDFPYKDRIDFAEYFIDENELKDDEKLNEALFAIESQLAKIMGIEKYAKHIYTGLTKDQTDDRAKGHARELRDPDKKGSAKVQGCKREFANKHDVVMTYLIRNIPVEYLEIMEVLVATIFDSQTRGCSAVIGNSKAWKRIEEYRKWQKRKDAESLSPLKNLTNIKKEYLQMISRRNPKAKRCLLFGNQDGDG